MDAFDIALTRLSTAHLKRIAHKFKKSDDSCESKEDYIDLLKSTMNDGQKLKALQDTILACRGSVTHFRFADGRSDFKLTTENGRATPHPKIIYVGKEGEFLDGLKLIQWSVSTGFIPYLDLDLRYRTVEGADVIHSFFEPKSGILQVRATIPMAKQVMGKWAELAKADPSSEVLTICIKNKDDLHKFSNKIGATIEKCTGRKLQSSGFDRISGTKHPNIPDLRGCSDYKQFLSEAEPESYNLAFALGGEKFKISIGLKSGAIGFMTNATEVVVRFVYDELKKFHGIQ